MAGTNDFQPFAAASGANVLSQADFLALAALATGFQAGTAQSAALNKVWRQSSIMAAVLAQFIVDMTGQNAVDDGTTATLEANLKTAINAAGITQPQSDSSLKLATTAFVKGVTNGKGGNVYYGGTPTSGTPTTYTRTFSFTAPSNGIVMALQSVNVGSTVVQPGTQVNTVTVTGSSSGTTSGTDTTLSNMTNSVVKAVVTGETVTVTGSLQSNGASGIWFNNGITLSYIFVPTN